MNCTHLSTHRAQSVRVESGNCSGSDECPPYSKVDITVCGSNGDDVHICVFFADGLLLDEQTITVKGRSA